MYRKAKEFLNESRVAEVISIFNLRSPIIIKTSYPVAIENLYKNNSIKQL